MSHPRPRKVNLACGDVYLDSNDWLNLDFVVSGPGVKRVNLLERLPVGDMEADLVYSSHFIEHVPRGRVRAFLSECHRILAPGGVLRLVTPDLENLCRTYLHHRDCGEHSEANFVVLEMVDQCVRSEPGGELGRYYWTLRSNPESSKAEIAFVRDRTGEDLVKGNAATQASRPPVHLGGGITRTINRFRRRVEREWVRTVIRLLPKAYREQNVSMATLGERHHWLWDFEQLRSALREVGFEIVERHSATSSMFPGFPARELDLHPDGTPRKGQESMYVEARKAS